MAELKFCGLTRAEDASEAARLGARYAGVIFAGGPRLLTVERAAAVLDACPRPMRRVGVFGRVAGGAGEIAAVARVLALDVVQLHGDPDPAAVDEVRRHFAGEVWGVLRLASAELSPAAVELFRSADAVVLDAKVSGALGGTGVTLDWNALAAPLAAVRAATRVVLAGGLTPENVGAAISRLAPDVVDVSSGVEAAPGIKDHARMRAFANAVNGGEKS